ncbi:hypothetical protein C8R44DRAFT_806641 [Mycena epipterygia]|nr:hypothetical protein C8R44DRAFT_806641 [Mycena epipterygia]
MAVKGLGLFAHCPLDLYGILAKSPVNAEVRSLFVETIQIYNSTVGKETFSPADNLRADAPAAHGSALTAPSTPHAQISAPIRSIERASPAAALKQMACGACATLKIREDVATCSGVRLNHKLICSTIASNKLLLDLAEKLGREPNLRGLLKSYAIGALGLLIADPLPCRVVLIIEAALVEATGRYTRASRRGPTRHFQEPNVSGGVDD